MGKKKKRAKAVPAGPLVLAPLTGLGQKKEEVYGYQTYFRELGYYLSRKEQYDKGMGTFTYKV